ncbi:hypothetical protein BC937DRAFT_88995 [Endogone sp. FLAS-F59071]|nr:hypothetical protein BC937DRAFT_88995 [Endogone sp. FLAS-F59071]|eukprot:RUS22469.1 hypothetical protein BC937DRAFT_88995 [Endogone sp. FLAS-F59071]
MEKREVYRLHLLKTFYLPLTFQSYHALELALSWAWNVRGLVKDLQRLLTAEIDIGYKTPPHTIEIATQVTPVKATKK